MSNPHELPAPTNHLATVRVRNLIVAIWEGEIGVEVAVARVPPASTAPLAWIDGVDVTYWPDETEAVALVEDCCPVALYEEDRL